MSCAPAARKSGTSSRNLSHRSARQLQPNWRRNSRTVGPAAQKSLSSTRLPFMSSRARSGAGSPTWTGNHSQRNRVGPASQPATHSASASDCWRSISSAIAGGGSAEVVGGSADVVRGSAESLGWLPSSGSAIRLGDGGRGYALQLGDDFPAVDAQHLFFVAVHEVQVELV